MKVSVFEVSVKMEFHISVFPLKISEIFLAVRPLREEFGTVVVQELLRKIEGHALENDLGLMGCQRHDYRQRTFSGVLGAVKLKLLRVQPVGEVRRLAIERYVELEESRYTADAFEASMGLLPHLSYRWSSKEGKRITGTGPGKSTLHRRVKDWGPDLERHPEEGEKGYRYLFVDGTGARLQEHVWVGDKRKVLEESGELQMVYASRGRKEPLVEVGRWVNTPWRTIAEEVYRRIDGSTLSYLFMDGEDAIEQAFLLPGMEVQRCSVHAWRSLKAAFTTDGMREENRDTVMEWFRSLPLFHYAMEDNLEALKPEDRKEVEKGMERSRQELDKLQVFLRAKGYVKTAGYLANLADPLMTFMRTWLEQNQKIPTTNNLCENRFSLIKNRIRNVGKRWSDEGLKRWVDLAVQKLFPGHDWNKFWQTLVPATAKIKGYIVAVA